MDRGIIGYRKVRFTLDLSLLADLMAEPTRLADDHDKTPIRPFPLSCFVRFYKLEHSLGKQRLHGGHNKLNLIVMRL
jgi:hypothetical protein